MAENFRDKGWNLKNARDKYSQGMGCIHALLLFSFISLWGNDSHTLLFVYLGGTLTGFLFFVLRSDKTEFPPARRIDTQSSRFHLNAIFGYVMSGLGFISWMLMGFTAGEHVSYWYAGISFFFWGMVTGWYVFFRKWRHNSVFHASKDGMQEGREDRHEAESHPNQPPEETRREAPVIPPVSTTQTVREPQGATEARQIRAWLRRIEHKAGDIQSLLERHPEKATLVRRSLRYYLDTAQRLVDRCVDLERDNSLAEGARERIRKGLRMIEDTLDKQRDMVLEADLEHLDIELKVLEKTIRFET